MKCLDNNALGFEENSLVCLIYVLVFMLGISYMAHTTIFTCLHGFWMLVHYSFILHLITIIHGE